MSNNQNKRCIKGLHQYKQRVVKDLGNKRHLLLKCTNCGREYKTPAKN